MWEKAQRLLNTPNRIIHAPGTENAWMVASESSFHPHFIQPTEDGRFLCHEQCLMWRGRKICSHTVSVTERVGLLPEFLQSLQKSKVETQSGSDH